MMINFVKGIYIYTFTGTLLKTNIYLDVNKLSIARSTNEKIVS